jgi:hypothetical protein
MHLYDIQGEGCHVFIQVAVNGKNANMLIDTGASRTVFDKNRIEKFIPFHRLELIQHDKLSMGLGSMPLESELFTIESLVIDTIQIDDYITVAINLAPVNELYNSLEIPAVDGVMGGDLLLALKAKIDYGKQTITLTKNKL